MIKGRKGDQIQIFECHVEKPRGALQLAKRKFRGKTLKQFFFHKTLFLEFETEVLQSNFSR